MAATEHPVDRGGYEKRDVTARPVLIVTGVILLLSFAVLVPTRLLFRYLDARERIHEEPPESSTRDGAATQAPEPRLEPIIGQTLAALRQHEHEVLSTYGWVDRGAGQVRLPIERALEVVASRGLPARAGAAPYRRFEASGHGNDGAGGSDSRATHPAEAPDSAGSPKEATAP